MARSVLPLCSLCSVEADMREQSADNAIFMQLNGRDAENAKEKGRKELNAKAQGCKDAKEMQGEEFNTETPSHRGTYGKNSIP